MHRECGHQFGFTACFQSEMKLLPGIDDLFNDLAQLIDLDRENTAVTATVAELSDRTLKRAVNRFDPMPKQILESNHQGKGKAAGPSFANDFQNVDRTTAILQWPNFDVAI